KEKPRPYFQQNFLQFPLPSPTLRTIGTKYVVVIDQKESKEYDGIIDGSKPIFSRDSKRAVFAAKKGNKYVAVIDGKESDEYDSIRDNEIKFINRSKYVVFVGTKEVSEEDRVESKSYLVVNNREIMSFKNLSTIVKTGKGFKFLAHIGSKLYLVTCK
ncbi:MAG: hypothetical protein ACK4NF_07675, partial [Planctomycetota bacterium]